MAAQASFQKSPDPLRPEMCPWCPVVKHKIEHESNRETNSEIVCAFGSKFGRDIDHEIDCEFDKRTMYR
eukprot:2754608-Pyramimonas_sp.AAC.1